MLLSKESPNYMPRPGAYLSLLNTTIVARAFRAKRSSHCSELRVDIADCVFPDAVMLPDGETSWSMT